MTRCVAVLGQAAVRRPSLERRLAPARRKQLTLAFAQLAARRLNGLIDPRNGPGGVALT